MSGRALSRGVSALRLYTHLRSSWAVYKAQHLCLHWQNGKQEKVEEAETVQQQPNAADAERKTLFYNPSAYYQKSAQLSALSGGAQVEEEASQPVLNAQLRQQSSPYAIRHSSVTKSPQLNFAVRRNMGSKGSETAYFQPNDIQPDVKGDPRAFHRCRPEYRNITHVLSQRPHAIHLSEALLLLQKVTSVKGSMEPSDIVHILCELSHLSPEQAQIVRGDKQFLMLLRYSMESLSNFTNQQLLEVMQAFVRLGLHHTHSILSCYEAEFAHRAAKMDLNQLLLVADLWRCLGRSVPHYLDKLCDCICQHFSQMGPPELVQFMYILGEGRRCPAHLLQPLEGMLMRHLANLEAEEVAAVCLGLFKSQSSLSEEAVRRLVDRGCALLEQMSDFGMANVLKLMRLSHLDHLSWLEAMGSEVPRRAPQMGVQGLMHVALACSSLHYRDDRIFMAIAEHLPPVASHCRSKDAAKLLWAFGSLGIVPEQCPGLYPCLTEILRERKEEFQRFPEHLLTGLLGLAFVGHFPTDLISIALSPEFINHLCKSQEQEMKKDLFTLDSTVRIELPGWTGPQLSQVIKEDVTTKLWEFAQSEVSQKLAVLEAEAVLQELLGGDAFVRKGMILPHMRSVDLEVHLDSNDQPLPVTCEPSVNYRPVPYKEPTAWVWEGHTGVTITNDLLAQLTSAKKIPAQMSLKPRLQSALRPVEPEREREGIISVGVDLTDGIYDALVKRKNSSPTPSQVASKPSVIRLAVQVTNRNNYCYRTQQLLGFHAMKRRQLELVGYRVVELPHWEWFPLLRRSRAEKRAYLHCKIFSSYDPARKT